MSSAKRSILRPTAFWLTVFSSLFFSGCSFQGQPDGGVYKSSDSGTSFTQKIAIGEKEDLGNTEVLSLAIDSARPETVYIGTKDKGILRSQDGGENWQKDKNEFLNVTDIVLNPDNSGEIYITADVGGRGKIMKTNNGGESWFEPFTQSTSAVRNWTIAIDRNNPKILYAGDSGGGIYKTQDAGETWKPLLWARSGIVRIETDAAQTSRLYVVTERTGVLKSEDGGAQFSEIPSEGRVYNLTVHPGKAGVLFLVDDEGLKKSVDAGASFSSIQTLVKMDKLGAQSLAVDPVNDQVMYVASGAAFYKTTDGGNTWRAVDLKFSRVIKAIAIDPVGHETIYLGAGARTDGGSGSFGPLMPF